MNINDKIWRLFCFRYLWLIFLGMIWVERGLTLTKRRFALVLVSIAFISLFAFTSVDMSPLFLTQSGWKNHHWICYFLVAFGIPNLLWWLRSHSGNRGNSVIEMLGEYSWEIFLMQMIVFQYIHSQRIVTWLGDTFGSIVYVLIVFFMSIAPVVAYKKISKQK